MIYNAEHQTDVKRAEERLKWLIEHKKRFELTEKSPTRSISQNNYLHLILTMFAYEYGETVDYVKRRIFKRHVNLDLFQYVRENPKTKESRYDLRSTASLNKKEMTQAITAFRNYSSKELGLYLPEPSDLAGISRMEEEVSRMDKTYL